MKTFALSLVVILALTACKEDVDSQLAKIDSQRDMRIEQISAIANPETRNALSYLADLFHYIQTGYVEAQKTYDGPTVYAEPQLKRLNDYNSVAEMAEIFTGSLWANRIYAGDLDLIPPFNYPLPHQLTWETAVLADGSEIMVTDEYDPTSDKLQAIFHFGDVRVVYSPEGGTPADASPISGIRGTFETHLPEVVLKTVFNHDEVGKTKALGDYLVKLVGAKDHLAIVEVTTADGAMPPFENKAVVIEALDETNTHLDRSSSSWGDPEVFKAAQPTLDKLIQAAVDGEIENLEEDALFAEITEQTGPKAQTSLYGQITFRGQIDKLEITLLEPEKDSAPYRKTLELTAIEFPGLIDGPDIPSLSVEGTVYDHDAETFFVTAPTDIETARVHSAITPEFDSYQSLVRFNYPEVISNVFLDAFDRYDGDAEQIAVSFLDNQNNPIEPTNKDAFEFTINRIEFDPTLFPAPPARVIGQFPVHVMQSIERDTYTSTTRPEAVAIVGNQVRIARNSFRNWDSDFHLIAWDEQGKLLKQVTAQGVTQPEDARTKVYYFYGNVAEVELLKAGPIETAIYEFDTPLTPQN